MHDFVFYFLLIAFSILVYLLFSYSAIRLQECSIKSVSQSVSQAAVMTAITNSIRKMHSSLVFYLKNSLVVHKNAPYVTGAWLTNCSEADSKQTSSYREITSTDTPMEPHNLHLSGVIHRASSILSKINPWQPFGMSNSPTFPDFSGKWSPCS